jgi:hypothetical protein
MKMNKSKTYLLPLFSELIDIKFVDDLENVYIKDDLAEHDKCIYLLYKFNIKDPKFTKYEFELTNNDLFVDLIDINDKVLYILKFPNDYIEEYNLYIEGKYSKFGSDAKELILKFWNDIYTGTSWITSFLIKTKQILYKEKSLKQQLELVLSTSKAPIRLSDDAELSDICDIKDETFELTTIKKEQHGRHKSIDGEW